MSQAAARSDGAPYNAADRTVADGRRPPPGVNILRNLFTFLGRLRVHPHYTIAAIFIGGLLLRALQAVTTYLNPDEALITFISVSPDWFSRSRTVHHPPLLFGFLHLVTRVNASELALRLGPIVAGSLYPWIAYRWIAGRSGRTAGFTALIILTFSPNLIALSAQVRGYTIMLAFAALAMWSLDHALEAGSISHMVVSIIALYAGILSEYAMVFFVVGAGLFGALSILGGRVKGAVITVWVLGQFGAAALYYILYLWQVESLAGSPDNESLIGTYLRGAFPELGQNVFHFAASGTLKQFSYLLTSIPLGALAILSFIYGTTILWRGQVRGGLGYGRRVVTATFLAFLSACVVAVMRVYPYGRSRHTIALSLFAVAIIGSAMTKLMHRKPVLGMAAAGALLVLWPYIADPDQHNIPSSVHQRDRMVGAINQLQMLTGNQAIIVADTETALLMRYYLCGSREIATKSLRGELTEATLGPFRTVWRHWDHEMSQSVAEDLSAVRDSLGLRPDERLWVVDGGFNGSLRSSRPASLQFETSLNGVISVFRTHGVKH